MSENVTQTVWLTQEAYDKLQAELDHLSGPGRAEVTAKIAAAREEGDLRENGGYHAAREEQGQQEARIRQLADMLRRAEVGEAPANADEVAPGTQVTIAFDGDESDTDTFVLGSRELLGLDDAVRHQRLQPAVAARRGDPGQEEGRRGLLRRPERPVDQRHRGQGRAVPRLSACRHGYTNTTVSAGIKRGCGAARSPPPG